MKCHLKNRDGWRRVINTDYVMGTRLTVTETRHYRNTTGMIQDSAPTEPRETMYIRRDFELVRSVEIRDHKKNVTVTEAWFEEL
jgi:hypothetical protein